MRYWIVFLIGIIPSFAQESPVYYDRGSYSFGAGVSFPQGGWASYLAPAGPFFHVDATVLWNPVAKVQRPSPVMVGFHTGLVGLGREGVSSALLGQFYRVHSLVWLQAVGRYRPILRASQWNPFIELGVGPGLYGSSLNEQLSEEVIRLDSQSSFGFTYQAGIGMGKRVPRGDKAPIYLDLIWHLFQTDGLSWVDRGSTRIDADGAFFNQRRLMGLNNQKITLYVTGFW